MIHMAASAMLDSHQENRFCRLRLKKVCDVAISASAKKPIIQSPRKIRRMTKVAPAQRLP